ncbi:hypothetical protein IAT38_001516 [Cryptococcus sp. DSM 104549]
MRFADIAVNLTDPMYTGVYRGRSRHASDLSQVVERARSAGVERILITGTSLQEVKDALKLAEEYNLHCTAGTHPTSTSEIDSHPAGVDAYFSELTSIIDSDRGEGGSKRIISIGEVGLDYDRLHHSPQSTQLAHLPALLRLSERYKLPLFLHSRTSESHVDLVRTLKEVGWELGCGGGVVHSFTGTESEMKELVDMGLYIGINGCSLRTDESLEVVKKIPADRLLLETDGPWCSPSSTHASHPHMPPADSPLYIERASKPEKFKPGQGVKGRMEPAEVRVIAHVVASVRGVPLEELASQVWDNTTRLFYPNATGSSS